MDEKIINLSKHDNEALPDAILRNLNATPEDIAKEFVGFITDYLEDIILLRNVISSINSPNLLHHLINSLSKKQLDRLHYIALHLASKNPIENVRELVKATFGFSAATSESFSKAVELIEQIKTCDTDYGDKGVELTKLSVHIQLLADTHIMLGLGKQFEDFMITRLSENYEEDLDELHLVYNDLKKTAML